MVYIPKDYHSTLDIRQTEVAIKAIKDHFQAALASALCLTRVSAPLYVVPSTGLNDDLNGVERPVAFGIREQGDLRCEIVHSLAKWKRHALKKYGFGVGEGLYTDMNAIRRDEDTDNIHSLYVDQWDWEKVITKEMRTTETLKETVSKIYGAMKDTEAFVAEHFGISPILPDEISFVTTQQLEDRFGDLAPNERENQIAKEAGAVFLMQIGGALASGKPHDGRAPDYDDWNLNGDILVYNPVLCRAFELSSMGIRVSASSLIAQLEAKGLRERLTLPFHQALLNGELPSTIGGGIGQSRLCMFFLRKAHIGEVQSSVWLPEDVAACEKAGICLL